jgi:hypothetical protein
MGPLASSRTKTPNKENAKANGEWLALSQLQGMSCSGTINYKAQSTISPYLHAKCQMSNGKYVSWLLVGCWLVAVLCSAVLLSRYLPSAQRLAPRVGYVLYGLWAVIKGRRRDLFSNESGVYLAGGH